MIVHTPDDSVAPTACAVDPGEEVNEDEFPVCGICNDTLTDQEIVTTFCG